MNFPPALKCAHLMLGMLLKIQSTHDFRGSCLHMSTNLFLVYYVRKLNFERNNPCADPEHSVIRVLTFCCHKRISEGRSSLPREAFGPLGSNCFSMGIRTSISNETYRFQGGYEPLDHPPLDPPMQSTLDK